jgi:hypothetical protein
MSVIGEPIDRSNYFPNAKFKIFGWFCCSLFLITFAFMTYLSWFVQDVTIGGRYGSPDTILLGSRAVNHGYVMFTCLMISLGAGFWYSSFKKLIWLMLSFVWLGVVIWVHFNLVL